VENLRVETREWVDVLHGGEGAWAQKLTASKVYRIGGDKLLQFTLLSAGVRGRRGGVRGLNERPSERWSATERGGAFVRHRIGPYRGRE